MIIETANKIVDVLNEANLNKKDSVRVIAQVLSRMGASWGGEHFINRLDLIALSYIGKKTLPIYVLSVATDLLANMEQIDED